ncbi:LPKTxAVK-anchored surface protein [Salibaculum sp.]
MEKRRTRASEKALPKTSAT